MAVKLRLMRMGKKKHPTYRVVAADSRSPRDGRFIELIGRYDPHPHPSVVEIDNERALHWLEVGAQPTDAVRKLLEISGAWGQFRVRRGDVHVVGEAAPPEERERKSKKARARDAEAATAAAAEPEAVVEEVGEAAGEPLEGVVDEAGGTVETTVEVEPATDVTAEQTAPADAEPAADFTAEQPAPAVVEPVADFVPEQPAAPEAEPFVDFTAEEPATADEEEAT